VIPLTRAIPEHIRRGLRRCAIQIDVYFTLRLVGLGIRFRVMVRVRDWTVKIADFGIADWNDVVGVEYYITDKTVVVVCATGSGACSPSDSSTR